MYPFQIGAIVIVVSLLLLHLFVIITNESESFREFTFLLFVAFLSWIVGLMAFCYLHFIWILPSRRLLVGLQQVIIHFFQVNNSDLIFPFPVLRS